MKLTDKFFFTRENVRPAGSPVSSRSVDDSRVMELVDRLSAEGVDISLNDSEQDITYRVSGKDKKATVPLNVSFGESVRVTGYKLRGNGLKLVLRDYHETTATGGGRIGGSVYGRDGISCKLKFSGANQEEGVSVLQAVKKVLWDFYR